MKGYVACFLFAFFATSAIAAKGDMTVGSFGTIFCGAPATFEVQTKASDSWVFEGEILIRDTGEHDALRITQNDDNSLRIVRYLSGDNTGKRQTVRTSPPKFVVKGGTRFAAFSASKGSGVGCNNQGAVTYLYVPY